MVTTKPIYKYGLFVVALLATLACRDVETPPPGPPPESYVAVYGDSRTGHDVHAEVVAGILGHEPAAVFHTGDLVEDGYNMADWITFFGITREMRAAAPFYPALGNHEGESPLFFELFDLPGNEQWYKVEVGAARFIILDTNVAFDPGSAQYRWLEDELKQPYAGFTCAVFHHPPYTVTRRDERTRQVQAFLVPLFDQYHVDVVFNGHDHNYQRFRHQVTYYVVTGGGGAPLYDQQIKDPSCEVFVKEYHYCILRVVSDKANPRMEMTAYDVQGDIIDTFAIDKNPPLPE